MKMRIKIKVKANARVVELLSEYFDVGRDSIRIVTGKSTKIKLVEIKDGLL